MRRHDPLLLTPRLKQVEGHDALRLRIALDRSGTLFASLVLRKEFYKEEFYSEKASCKAPFKAALPNTLKLNTIHFRNASINSRRNSMDRFPHQL